MSCIQGSDFSTKLLTQNKIIRSPFMVVKLAGLKEKNW